ncbi:MAG: TonB-dependent receptor, partial [Phascolarctobacterium sp.]|nr:TonB-dependent receptor [Phascolarctobacterium sp.]
AAVASVGFVMSASAEEVQSHNLDTLTVEGRAETLPGGLLNSSGTVGLLGEQKVMDTDFSTYNVSNKYLETFIGSSEPLDRALANVPSINPSGSVLHGDFNIRGFRTNGNAFYVNGVNGMMTQFNVPTFAIESIDIVSGPNSMLGTSMVVYEGDTAGGLINMRTKRAGEKDFIRYKQTFSGKGAFGEYIDVSHRLGKNKEWGIRINAENLNGETAMDEARVKSKGIALNIDHKGSKSNTNLFATYTDKDVYNGVRWFKLVTGGVTHVPSSVDGSKNYSANGTWKAGYGWFATLNHEQNINKNWTMFANAGYSRQLLNQNVSPYMSSYWIKNDAGDYDLLQTNSVTPQRIYYSQIGSKNKFKTGSVKHTLITSLDKEWRNRETAPNLTGNKTVGVGNIYTHILNQLTSARDVKYGGFRHNNRTSVWGASILDNLEFGKWNAMIGVHKHEGNARSYTYATDSWKSVKSSGTCPTYSLGYKPSDKWLIYGNHSENFNLGATAPQGTANEYQIVDPAKTKQNEIGFKYSNHGNLLTVAYFDIDQTSYMTNDANFYAADGKINHKGVELSYSGKLAKKWNGNLALAWMDAKYEKTSTPFKNGAQETGQPRWRGSAALEYEADERFKVMARATYTGSTPFYTVTNKTSTATANSLHLSAKPFMVYDLGVAYNTKINSVPVKLMAMCYNLFDKDYWMVSRGDQIYTSAPRTFFLSATFEI